MPIPSRQQLLTSAKSKPSKTIGSTFLILNLAWEWITKLGEHAVLTWVADNLGQGISKMPFLEWAIHHPFLLLIASGVSYCVIIVLLAKSSDEKDSNGASQAVLSKTVDQVVYGDLVNSPTVSGNSNQIVFNHPPPPAQPIKRTDNTNPECDINPLTLTLHDLFMRDFRAAVTFGATWPIGEPTDIPGSKIQFLVLVDIQVKSRFLKFYVSLSRNTYDLCVRIANTYMQALQYPESSCGIATQGPAPGESRGHASNESIFTGAVFIYYEGELSTEHINTLHEIYEAKGLRASFRGPAYLAGRKAPLMPRTIHVTPGKPKG